MFPYPQRPGSVAPSPGPSAFVQPQQPPPVYVPPPPPVAAPTFGLAGTPSGSITTLRLKLSDDVRIDPPVAVSAALLPSAGPQQPACPDLSLERQLLEAPQGQSGAKAGAAGTNAAGEQPSSAVSSDVETYLAGIQSGELPQNPAIKQLAAGGMSPAAAALGVLYARTARGDADKAAEFASGVEQLTTMGFSLPLAAGALAKHKGDLEAATESCLAAAS